MQRRTLILFILQCLSDSQFFSILLWSRNTQQRTFCMFLFLSVNIFQFFSGAATRNVVFFPCFFFSLSMFFNSFVEPQHATLLACAHISSSVFFAAMRNTHPFRSTHTLFPIRFLLVQNDLFTHFFIGSRTG